MGNSNSGFNNVNNMAQQSFQNYNDQRNQFGNTLGAGLAGAQGRSDQVFNTALGGYNSLLGNIQGALGSAGGGGVSQATMDAINAIGGPGNPWAGQLGRDVRTRENSVLPGFFDKIAQEQTRLQNIQGGYNPGYTAQMSKLARDQAKQAQEGVLNTEIEIGKNSAAAQAAQAAFELQKQGMLASMQAQAGAASAADRARLLGLNLSALGGLEGLRTDVPGEVGMYLSGMSNNLGAGQAGAQGALGQMFAANPRQTPWWQTALGTAAGLAGPLGNLFGGGGGQRNLPSTGYNFNRAY